MQPDDVSNWADYSWSQYQQTPSSHTSQEAFNAPGSSEKPIGTPWLADGVFIPPKKPGGLGIYNGRFVRLTDTGIVNTTAAPREGWDLAVGNFIRGNVPKDPKILGALALKVGSIVRMAATKRFVPTALVAEAVALVTPIPGDEVFNLPFMATLAATGVLGVVKERRRLQGKS